MRHKNRLARSRVSKGLFFNLDGAGGPNPGGDLYLASNRSSTRTQRIGHPPNPPLETEKLFFFLFNLSKSRSKNFAPFRELSPKFCKTTRSAARVPQGLQ